MSTPVRRSDLAVGQALLWDVRDKEGTLILKRGEIVPSQGALDRLVKIGMYSETSDAEFRATSGVQEEKASALQHIVDARRSLFSIYAQKPEQVENFPLRMEKLVQLVKTACDSQATMSLASILMMHEGTYTIKHPIDVAILSCSLAKEMGLDDAARQAIVAAALTMNIGMYEVQEQINAISGPLNAKLMSMIETHPNRGADRLVHLGIAAEDWIRLVRQHHEHSDGSGYPDKLSGDAIDMGARIISFSDMYCAMISGRKYRGPQKPNVALRELCIKHGAKIDVSITGAMIHLVGIYPPGTLVRLKTTEIGVVTGPGQGPDTPEVHAVFARSGAALDVASYRRTHLPNFAIEEVLTYDKIHVPIRMASIWGKDARLN